VSPEFFPGAPTTVVAAFQFLVPGTIALFPSVAESLWFAETFCDRVAHGTAGRRVRGHVYLGTPTADDVFLTRCGRFGGIRGAWRFVVLASGLPRLFAGIVCFEKAARSLSFPFFDPGTPLLATRRPIHTFPLVR